MSWIPVGPISVIDPRFPNYTRISRANAWGAQCAVLDIAIDPGNEQHMVVVTRRVGGSSAFRTTDGGQSWRAIADDLTRINPLLDISCAALHPAMPEVVFLGTRNSSQVLVSTDGGENWSEPQYPGGTVTRLIVDRNSGPDLRTTVLYAATNIGVAISNDGSATWNMAAIGEVSLLAVYMPLHGPRKFWAGVYDLGLLYNATGTGTAWRRDAWDGAVWQNLFVGTGGVDFTRSPGSHKTVYVDFSPRQPERVYALVVSLSEDHRNTTGQQLYCCNMDDSVRNWHLRGSGDQPQVDIYLEGVDILVAPEPNGVFDTDMVICTGGDRPGRTTNGGTTWDTAPDLDLMPNIDILHHADVRSLAQFPPKTAYYPDTLAADASVVPRARIYVGSDGGLCVVPAYTDPRFNLHTPVAAGNHFNADTRVDTATPFISSLNNGLASLAGHQYASNPDPLQGGPMSIIGYATSLDTGCARHIGGPCWTAASFTDGGLIFMAQQPDGLRVWANLSRNIIFPTWNLLTWLDQGLPAPVFEHVVTTSASSCGATCNMVSDGEGGMYTAIIAREPVSALRAAVNVDAGTHETAIYPDTMSPEFVPGARIGLLPGPDRSVQYQEIVTVADDHFTVLLPGPVSYPARTPLFLQRYYPARVRSSRASRIGQGFPQSSRFYRMTRAGNTLLAASVDQQLWLLTNAASATESSNWYRIPGRPSELTGSTLDLEGVSNGGEYVSGLDLQGTEPLISCLCSDAAGEMYVLLSRAVSSILPDARTVLFRVAGGIWLPEPCEMPIAAMNVTGTPLARMVAHPVRAGRLYVASYGGLFQLDRGPDAWVWTDLSTNLPGQQIHDLWIGNIAPSGPARFMLRVLTSVRGVWEYEIDAPAPTSRLHPYFRDHAFDPGWTGQATDGVASPLNPARRYYHWQSADIKVDTPMIDSAGAPYYQNTASETTLSATDFAWLKDRSDAAVPHTEARVWVQVNHRAPLPGGPLVVWAIRCNFATALPRLPPDFWSSFRDDGSVMPVPLGTDWTSLGIAPVSRIHAEEPGIVRFNLAVGEPGQHSCIVAFVHGAGALLDTRGLSLIVDEIVPANLQIAQRNVIALPSMSAETGAGGASAETGAGAPPSHAIEFNNPQTHASQTTLHFDLRGLPAAFTFHFRLSRNIHPKFIKNAKTASFRFILLNWLKEKLRRWHLKPAGGKGKTVTPAIPLDWTIYKARGGTEVIIGDFDLPAGGKAAAQFQVQRHGPLLPGHTCHLDLLQYSKDRLVGGASMIMPVASNMNNEPRATDTAENAREIAGEKESQFTRGVDQRQE